MRGALGISDLPAARAHTPTAPILTLDGVQPSCDNVRLGRYPLYKDLAFVTRGAPSDLSREFPERETSRQFLAFVASEEGRALIEAEGGIAFDASGDVLPALGSP